MLEHAPRKHEVECRVVERQLGEIGDVRRVEIRIRRLEVAPDGLVKPHVWSDIVWVVPGVELSDALQISNPRCRRDEVAGSHEEHHSHVSPQPARTSSIRPNLKAERSAPTRSAIAFRPIPCKRRVRRGTAGYSASSSAENS